MTDVAGHVNLHTSRGEFTLAAAFDLPRTGITGIFGPSGCGKTTLLRSIAGLERDCHGRVVVQGETWQDEKTFLPPHRRAAGYVFQEPRLFPHLTVERNLRYGQCRNGPGEVGFDQVVELLGIAPLLARKPASLSGGERQRAAIARALLRNPRLVLMDEPLANLDTERKQEILPFLERLHARIDLPILYVSHSLDEISHLCDRMVVLNAGRVVATGSLQEVLARDDIALPAGEEHGAVLEGRIEGYDAEYELTRIEISAGMLFVPGQHGAAGNRVRLRVLARDISLALERPTASSILNILPVRVTALHPRPGGFVSVLLEAGTEPLQARISRRSVETLGLAPGTEAYAQLKSVAVRHGA